MPSKIFDEAGNIIESPNDPVFNDLTKAPIISAIGDETPYLAVVLRAKNGMFRLGLLDASGIVKPSDLTQAIDQVARSIPAPTNLQPVMKAINDVAATIPPAVNLAPINQSLSAMAEAETALAGRLKTLEDKPAPTMPAAATATPMAIALDGAKGTSPKYALEDHTHAARVQRKIVQLDGGGLATWNFTRAFAADNEPSLTALVFQPSGDPVVVEAVSWIRETMTPTPSGKFIGVNVRGYRAQRLPTLTPLSGVLTLLAQVISGVNTVITTLTGFNIFGGGNLSGVRVHLSAGDQL